MKKKILCILGIILTLVVTFNVEAATNSISLSISCPSAVNPESSITCKVSATVAGHSATIRNVSVTTESPITSAKTDIASDTTLEVGSKTNIGTITAKASSISGVGRVNISMDARFSDGEPLNKYNVRAGKVIEVVSSVNTLNSIKIDGNSIPNFNKDITSYYISTNKEAIKLTATRTSSKSTITGTGTKNLKCGNNTSSIVVKAENGKSKKYTVNINRKCNNNAYLAGISLSNGTLSPDFKEDVYKYTVKLDKNVDKITVKGVKGNQYQKIAGEVENKKVEYGKMTVNLVVTSQTGVTKTYSINFDKNDDRDDNSFLSSLSLSSGTINFDKNTLEYETKVLYDISKIEVLAVPEKATSTVKVTGNENLKVGENVITISVKSEKGKTTNYKVKVTRLKEGETLGDNANIKSLKVANYDLPFDYNKTDYKLVINNEEKLNINVIMDDPSSTYEITGNENLKDGSVIKIVTKSQNGTSKTYTIEVTKPSYLIYFIIGGSLIALAIAIPAIVYFKTVKKKKELLDVNGYKIGKEENNSQTPSRKIISNSSVPNQTEVQNSNNQIQTMNQTVNNQNPVNPSQVDNPIITNNQVVPNQTQIDNQSLTNNQIVNNQNPINNQVINNQDFHAGLQNYVPNETKNQCPGCGRELLGNPNECPYCKTKLN